jgi:hypothetical protein
MRALTGILCIWRKHFFYVLLRYQRAHYMSIKLTYFEARLRWLIPKDADEKGKRTVGITRL